jgi:hypothetical protein
VSAATPRRRIVRTYTAARRHPFKVGRFGDWQVPFGPYTPAQLIVLVGGAVLLIRTFSFWSVLGPVPVIVWLVAVWAVRGSTIRGRSPLSAAWGWVLLAAQPPGGRINGRAVQRPRPVLMSGAFSVTPALAGGPAPARVGAAGTEGRSGAGPRPVPVSSFARLLAAASEQRPGEDRS